MTQGRTDPERTVRGQRRLRARPGRTGPTADPSVGDVRQPSVRPTTASAAGSPSHTAQTDAADQLPNAAAAADHLHRFGALAVQETVARGHRTGGLGRGHTHRPSAVMAAAGRPQKRRPDQFRKVQVLVFVQLQISRDQIRKYDRR